MSDSFTFHETCLAGCVEIISLNQQDERGRFIKLYHQTDYPQPFFPQPLAEEFYTVSRKRVLRGLHFQIPPMEVAKLVTCLEGTVMDVVVDLRVGSPTYGRHEINTLSSCNGKALFIPPGLAHGFYVNSEIAVLLYKVNKVYSPECDTGIQWASAGVQWPDVDPILSERDRNFAPLSEFSSPFRYEGK